MAKKKGRLIERYLQFTKALENGNVDVLDRLIADNFVLTGLGGKGKLRIGKARLLSLLRSGSLSYSTVKPGRVVTQIAGATGVVSGSSSRAGQMNGNKFKVNTAVMSVWSRTVNNRWKLVAGHLGFHDRLLKLEEG